MARQLKLKSKKCFFMTEDVKKEVKKKKEVDKPGALFIPAGVLGGMGIGFLIGNIPGAMFLGLGIGFFFFAIAEMFTKKSG